MVVSKRYSSNAGLVLGGALIIAWITTGVLISYDLQIADRWWVSTVLIVPLLLLYQVRQRLPEWGQGVFAGILLGLVAGNVVLLAKELFTSFASPRTFDFPLFWVFGRVAVQGFNFYDQANLLRVAQPLAMPPEFTHELFVVHTPPMVLLYFPLGWLNLSTAYLVWNSVNVIILAIDIVLLWRMFLLKDGYWGLLLISVVTLMSRGTILTVMFAQTNFLLLLLALLFMCQHDRARSGIWLTLGVLIKPFFVLIALYPFVRRQWRVFVASGLTLAAAFGMAILVFGMRIVASYRGVSAMPDSFYTMPFDQSLMAVALRLTHFDIHTRSPFLNPPYLIISTALIAFTLWLAWRLASSQPDYVILLSLSLSLVIFPHILQYYQVLLLIPMFWLWSRREDWRQGALWLVALFAVETFFMAANWGNWGIIATSLNLSVLMGMGVTMLVQRRRTLSVQANF